MTQSQKDHSLSHADNPGCIARDNPGSPTTAGDSFDLLAAIRADRAPKPAPKRKEGMTIIGSLAALPIKAPDALVLAVIRVTCDSCKSTSSYPSSHLMIRRGNHLRATSESMFTLEDLPREHVFVSSRSRMCLQCFGSEKELQSKDILPSPEATHANP